MGATLTISAVGESRAHAINAISAAFAEFNRLDRLLSVYQHESTVSRINRAAGRETIAVEEEVFAVIDRGRAYCTQLEGAFDITLEPLMRAWGFRSKTDTGCPRPSEREILQLLEAVGPEQIELDAGDRTVRLHHPAAAIDLGGFGVGFALDRAVAILRQRGIDHALLNHSGDIYAIGNMPSFEGWPIAIPDPRHPQRLLLACTLRNRSLSTSGSYQNFRREGTHVYGHLMSPRTGHPAQGYPAVTVIADSALEADVLSTAAYCAVDASVPNAAADRCSAEILRFIETSDGRLIWTSHLRAGLRPIALHFLEE